MFRGIGPVELGLVLLIVLIIFGAGKVPQIGASLGKGIREFKRASRGDYDGEVSPGHKELEQSAEKPSKS